MMQKACWITRSDLVKLIRTRAEERKVVTNKSPAKVNMRVVCFFKYCSAECVSKGNWNFCQECNVWNQEIYVDAKEKHFIWGRCLWSYLYPQWVKIAPTDVYFRSKLKIFIFFKWLNYSKVSYDLSCMYSARYIKHDNLAAIFTH